MAGVPGHQHQVTDRQQQGRGPCIQELGVQRGYMDFTTSSTLGLMRLATTMMSLTLADVFILAPEPIVMATSFSVRV